MKINKGDIKAIRDARYYLQQICKTLPYGDTHNQVVIIVQKLTKVYHLLQLAVIEPPLSLDLLIHGDLDNDHPFCKGVKILIDSAGDECKN